MVQLPMPKLRIANRRGSLVRTSREVSNRTLMRIVLTAPGTDPTKDCFDARATVKVCYTLLGTRNIKNTGVAAAAFP